MKYYLHILLILFIWITTYSNFGSSHYVPGVNGGPIIYEETDFSVKKETLNLFFYREGKYYKCKFTAKYHINNNGSDQNFVFGSFYGIHSQNVKIYSGTERIDTLLAIEKQQHLDSLFMSIEEKRLEHHLEWWKMDQLSKTGFVYNYNNSSENVITVTGETTLEYATLGLATPPVLCRHPFTNKSSGLNLSSFKYLISPIMTWKDVGPINVNVTYPVGSKLDIKLSSYENLITFLKRTSQPLSITNSEIDNKKYSSFSFILYKDLPFSLDFIFEDQKQAILVGGPKVGFGKNYDNSNFAMRYGWEIAAEYKGILDVFFSLDFDTDYKQSNTIAVSTYVMSPWFIFPFWIPNLGAGVGAAYDIENEQIGLRLLHESNFGLLGFSGSYDYFPESELWKISLMGQITF